MCLYVHEWNTHFVYVQVKLAELEDGVEYKIEVLPKNGAGLGKR